MNKLSPFIFFVSATMVFADIELPDILSNGMLLQRGVRIPIWGKATPGEKITVQFAGQTQNGTTGKDGRFQIFLDPLKESSQNREMTIHGSSKITLKEILVGDVWFCSGQSNMDFCLDANTNKKEERLAANYPAIRLFFVNRAHSQIPLDRTKSQWKRCENWNAAVFSAVGYFFGRELHRTLNIPIGLIDASYGGTPIEPWFSREKYESVPAIRGKLADIKGGDKGNRGFMLGYANPDFDDSNWKTLILPRLNEKEMLMKTEGEFWLRKTVDIPKDWEGKLNVLELGRIQGIDTVYLNGKKIASSGYDTVCWWERRHTYRKFEQTTIPTGKATLAIRIFGNDIKGCEKMYMQRYARVPKNNINLAGEWKFQSVYTLDPVEADHKHYTAQPTVLYNAMIAPLQPFPIRGAIWYQGESNASRPKEYFMLFKALAEDWRTKWNCGNFPIYFVQLPAYRHGGNWPEFRLVQDKIATQIPNTDMIVTLDIGDPNDIHPRQKLPFGLRLANLALAKTYDKQIPCKGPRLKEIRRNGKTVIATFDSSSGLSSREPKDLPGFELAGKDGSFYPASASIQGNEVVLNSKSVDNPIKIRYAWGNIPLCGLQDSQGLPAAPFARDIL